MTDKNELVDLVTLSDRFKRDAIEIEEILTESKIAGFTMSGRLLFPSSVIDFLTERFKPTDPLAAVIKHIDKRADQILASAREVMMVSDKLDTALAALSKMTEQNKALLRAIEARDADFRAFLDDFAAAESNVRDIKEWIASWDVTEEPEVVVKPGPFPLPNPNTVTITPYVKPPPHNPEPAADDSRTRKLKIGITGLLGDQQNMMQAEFGKVFDLRFFVSSTAKGAEYVKSIKVCDHHLLMTSFSSHFVTDGIIKSGVKNTNVRGGMTDLRDHLRKLFEQRPQP